MKKSALPLTRLVLVLLQAIAMVNAEQHNLRHFTTNNNKVEYEVQYHKADDGQEFVTTEIEYHDEPVPASTEKVDTPNEKDNVKDRDIDVKIQHFRAADGQEWTTMEIDRHHNS